MKVAIALFALLHGLLHLPGFIKGLGLKEVKGITLPVSKSMGFVWLSAAVLMLIYGMLHSFQVKYAWLAGFIAVIISQTLVILFWKDAKFGTIANLIIFLISIVSLGNYLIKSDFSERVTSDFASNNQLSTDILTEKDIAHLPDIVQDYLRYTKSVGQPKVSNFRAEFVGGMRGKPTDDYMNFHSVQYNFYQQPSRYFFMEATKAGFPATGLHTYQNSTATFMVKMMNWFKVVDAKGNKLNQAETVTLFNDMCFIAPPTLIDERIKWEVINDTTVKGFFKNGSITVSAILYFTPKGKLVNFISYDRYETDGNYYHNFPWETPVENYTMMNGYFLPGKAKLIYQKPGGNFVYGELEYKSVKYNLNRFED